MTHKNDLDDVDAVDEYGKGARFFHWVMALVILGLIAVGFFMSGLPDSPEKFQIYGLHKSFGLLILWLVGLRVVWRHVVGAPPSLATHANWEKLLAKATHVFLYVAMFGVPLSGWLMSSSAGYPVQFFGVTMPPLMGKNMDVSHMAKEVHEVMATLLLLAVGLHAAGAVKHHFMDKDTTLTRMVPRHLVYPVLGAIALLGALILLAMALGEEEEEDAKPVAVSSAPAMDMPELRDLAPDEWQIIPGESKLSFIAKLSGTPFEGVFGQFDGTIFFNPDDLKLSRASIVIPIASLSTGNAERDAQIGTPDWFDLENFPTATFETVEFAKGEGNNYVAVGNLTLRGVTLPVSLPFTFETSTDANELKRAVISGKATLNRLDYGIGQGQWTSTSTIADPVEVAVKVTAVSR